MIVAGDCFGQIAVYIGFARKHSHHGEAIVAGGAERAEPFYIRDCHNSNSLANRPRTALIPKQKGAILFL